MSAKQQWFYPTAFSAWGDEERAAIDRVLTSGRFTQGEEVAEFEREFAAYHHRSYGIMVNSGSSANLIAVAALHHLGKIEPGDKAIVPALAWSTTYAPVVQHGLDLVLADCDGTWNADPYGKPPLDPDSVTLMVGCSILGNPAHLTEWRTFAGVIGAAFIEDNCESLGAMAPDGLCGTFGLMSTFSFFYSHQISAIEGGMVLTDDPELNGMCRMLRAHGWTRDLYELRYPHLMPFEQEYDFRAFGYNVRGLELHAAIAREQLKKLPDSIEWRRENLDCFQQFARGLPITHPEPNGEPSPFGLHFTVKDQPTRNRLAVTLREAGIDCRLPTGGSFTKHAYGAPWADQRTPNADRVHETGLFLGNGPLDLGGQIAMAVGVMKEVL